MTRPWSKFHELSVRGSSWFFHGSVIDGSSVLRDVLYDYVVTTDSNYRSTACACSVRAVSNWMQDCVPSVHVHVISYLYVCILPSYFHGVLEVVLLYLLRGRS